MDNFEIYDFDCVSNSIIITKTLCSRVDTRDIFRTIVEYIFPKLLSFLKSL
jgi:hypothetical protein